MSDSFNDAICAPNRVHDATIETVESLAEIKAALMEERAARIAAETKAATLAHTEKRRFLVSVVIAAIGSSAAIASVVATIVLS